jgi:hypothetical protein
MKDRSEVQPGEVAASSDPLALAKRVAWRSWPYAAGLVVILAVLGIVFRHSLSWGDVPTWVMAITTLLAFLAAAFAGLVAYDLLRVENARDLAAASERLVAADDRKRAAEERAAEREAGRRAQASKITAWFDFYTPGMQVVPGGPVLPAPTDVLEAAAAVRIASELPILDVRVFFFWVNDPGDNRPWIAELRYASRESIRVIPPGQISHHRLPQHVRSMADECNGQVYVVGAEFTDANGVRWMRDARGALQDPSAATVAGAYGLGN